jgi:hypothetical protein
MHIYRNNCFRAVCYTDSYSRKLEASRRMRMISGIKITGNAKLKINYNERTEIKAGRKIVKNTYEVRTYSKRR